MQLTRSTKSILLPTTEDDQGFLRDDRLLIKEMEASKSLNSVTIELPEGKDLIDCMRPTDMLARCLATDDLSLAPYWITKPYSSLQTKSLHVATERPRSRRAFSQVSQMVLAPIQHSQSTLIQSPVSRRVYNGRGKTLYEYFEQGSEFECVYQKTVDNRSHNQLMYDYTANIKVLEFANDYDPKLYAALKQPSKEKDFEDRQLTFDSKFQSGNLYKVFRNTASEYYLLLENDTNTHGYNNWFYYRVDNTIKGTYTFHIMNMTKRSSMYKNGMKVSVFSQGLFDKYKRHWHRSGEDITYTNTKIERTTKQNEFYYCLAFTYTFEQQHDSVYFALNPPYTLTRLTGVIRQIEPAFTQNKLLFSKKIIGYTIANNPLVSLTVTEQNSIKNKRVMLFMARQHPGQTVGSFVAEGVMEELANPTPQTLYMLKHFRVVIIPMINPDGVIYGHSRCNLAGLDLNRQWGSQSVKQLCPQTHIIKKYIATLHEQYGIEVMIDFHGHSKKMNSFFYACKKQNKCNTRLLSFAMSKLNSNFDLYSCTYGVSKDKINTIRNQLYNMGINAYTLENSYYGRQRNSIRQHFSEGDLKGIGASIIKSLFLIYADKEAFSVFKMNKQVLLEQLQSNIQKLEAEENKINREDSGSESDPDGDLLALDQRVKTIKVRDQYKKSKFIHSFGGVLKKKKYFSSLYKQKLRIQQQEVQRLERQKMQQQAKTLKTQELTIPSTPVQFAHRVKRKPASRMSTIYIKKFEKVSKPPVRAFKMSKTVHEKSDMMRKDVNMKNLIINKMSSIARMQYQHPSRKKTIRQPFRFVKTQESEDKSVGLIENKVMQVSSKRPTERISCDLNQKSIEKQQKSENMQRFYQMQKKKSLDETQFMKIESVYRTNRKQREVFYSTTNKAPKQMYCSRKKIKSNGTTALTMTPQDQNHTKFKKFQRFLTQGDRFCPSAEKYRGIMGYGDHNSVFYRFPLL